MFPGSDFLYESFPPARWFLYQLRGRSKERQLAGQSLAFRIDGYVPYRPFTDVSTMQQD